MKTNPITRGADSGLTGWQQFLAMSTGGASFGGSLQRERAKQDKYNQQRIGQAGLAASSDLYQKRQELLNRYQSEDATARTGALGSVAAGYGNRQSGYDQAYNANLSNSLAGLGAQYQQGMQQNALANARRGRTGSSYDAEQKSGLQYGYQSGAANASNDAYGYSEQLHDADFQQQQALRRAILSGDPQSGAAYQAQAAGANNQSSALAGQSSLNTQQRLLNQAYGDAQSRQYGGYGQAGANYVYARNGVYGA